jgi:zinc metalloprotease ZmpB
LERGWRLDFINAGGSKFSLGPGETAQIFLRLTPGKEFQTQDVVNTRDRKIHVFGYADGILIGGMSYELDPNLKEPTPPISGNKECKEVAKELLDCLNLETTKIKKVRIRKVTLDIEFDDPDCKEDC